MPFLAGFIDDLEPLDEALRLTGLGGLLLGGLRSELATDLVVVLGLPAGVLHALLHPCPLGASTGLEF